MANIIRTQANGMHKKIYVKQTGNGRKRIILRVNRRARIRVKRA